MPTPANAAESEPGANAEADSPIADQREDQRPARVMKAAQHARADHLRPVDQLEGGGDANEVTARPMATALAGTSTRNKVTSERGKAHMPIAIAPMKPTPRPQAAQPARVMPASSPRPSARPTRTVAAWPSPSGTMKVRAAS